MNKQQVQAASDNSWLEAAKKLITAAQQTNKDVRSLTIIEDALSQAGKFRLTAKLS